MEKQLKKKLTDEQFSQLSNKVIEQSVENKVSRIWDTMSGELIRIMRKHRISEERVSAICTEFHETMIKKFGEVKGDEGLFKRTGAQPGNGADGHTPNDGECEVQCHRCT
jgi:hypothetical protein